MLQKTLLFAYFTIVASLSVGDVYGRRPPNTPCRPSDVCCIDRFTNRNACLKKQAFNCPVFWNWKSKRCVTLKVSNPKLDPSFGQAGIILRGIDGNDYASAVAVQQDGKLLVAGDSAGNGKVAVVRYHRDGKIDSSFGNNGITAFTINGPLMELGWMALQSNGKIVLVGTTPPASPPGSALFVARLNPDGSMDSSFSTNGYEVTNIGASGTKTNGEFVLIEQGGQIMAGGTSNSAGTNDFALVRYTPKGQIDPSFGAGGIVLTDINAGSDDSLAVILLQSDGKILAVGHSSPSAFGLTDFSLVRYRPKGKLDFGFGTNGIVTTDIGRDSYDIATSAVIQPDGKVIAAGYTTLAGNFRFALVRYLSDGRIDKTFNKNGIVVTGFQNSDTDTLSFIALKEDGKILTGGGTYIKSKSHIALVRFNSDGSLDTLFDGDGKFASDLGLDDFEIESGVLVTSNSVVAVGYSENAGTYDFLVVKYLYV